MITIDVSDNERDWRLFGLPSEDLSHHLEASNWSLEDAVAISLGYEPDNLRLALIYLKCPEEIRDRPLRGSREVLYRLSSVAQMYMGRLSLLQRAIEMEELPAKLINGEYKFKPFDFLRWFDAQTGDNWNFIPMGMTSMLDALVATDTEKKAPQAADTRRRKGRRAALNHLICQMRKSPNCAPHEKRTALRQKVMDQFNIGKNIADDVISEAQELTKVYRYKRGRPSKRK